MEILLGNAENVMIIVKLVKLIPTDAQNVLPDII